MSIVILAHGLWGPYEQDRISIVCLTYAYRRYEILVHSVVLCCKTTETRDRAQKRKEERILLDLQRNRLERASPRTSRNMKRISVSEKKYEIRYVWGTEMHNDSGDNNKKPASNK